jgi:hypothetical protein
MYKQNSKGHFAVSVVISIWLFAASGCNKAATIDRVSITPSVPPGQTANRIEVKSGTPPTQLTPGQQAELSADVSQQGSNLRVQWFAPQNKGQFTRPTDNLSTTFVAPNDPGPVEIAFQVASNGETKIVHVPIVVVSSATPVAPTPVSGATPGTEQAAPYDVDRGGFVPCGWMGDAEDGETYLRSQEISERTPFGTSVSKWSFRPGGKKGWLAVGWQFGDCNWGDAKGIDLRSRGLFKRVTVWAKGVPDSENKLPVIQFKAGGNADPTKRYKASFSTASEFLTLTSGWQQYHLDLQGEDLSSVISAFTIVLRSKDNPKGATFYLGGINYNAGN